MTRIFIFILIFYLDTTSLIAQDVVNPYSDYSFGSPSNPSGLMPGYSLNTSGNPYTYTSIMGTGTLAGYIGEYMIDFDFFFWMQDYPGLPNTFKRNLAKSYTIETVGFPFSMNCIYNASGCADGLSVRNLEMPNDPLINDKWGANLWRIKQNIPILPWTSGSGPIFSEGADLVSYAFLFSQSILGSQPFYPHSVHKITIYLHCGTTTASPIIDQVSFLYDHTRGRMREYPFIQSNINSSASQYYDVIFLPQLLYKTWGHLYGETTNDDIYINGKTINYFPNQNSQTCNGIDFSSTSGNYFYDGTAFQYAHPAEYCLVSSLLYSSRFKNKLAGYDFSAPNQLTKQLGVPHHYFIQSNFDLTLINPTDQTIYNPSEVTITASNLLFPDNYTFRTIRGTYPTATEAANDNIPESGCPPPNYCDLRFLPVTTDLTTENPNDATNFPLSAQAVTQHLYASRYYLDNTNSNNPFLTIGNCVRLFDATFDVKQGTTMQFNDYSTIHIKEDHGNDHTHTRYKIQTLGGAVLRNYASDQYLQNGDITQTQTLNYLAVHSITAGKNVDPDTDVPQNNYILEPGSNVTMQATDVISLKDGFRAKFGCTLHAVATTVTAPGTTCPPPPANRLMSQNKIKSLPDEIQFLLLPNPSSGHLKLQCHDAEHQPATITFTDVLGKTILQQPVNKSEEEINLETVGKGIYIAKFIQGGSSTARRVVIE